MICGEGRVIRIQVSNLIAITVHHIPAVDRWSRKDDYNALQGVEPHKQALHTKLVGSGVKTVFGQVCISAGLWPEDGDRQTLKSPSRKCRGGCPGPEDW